MNHNRPLTIGMLALLVCAASASRALTADSPDFARDIAPLFTKYCTGCHNDTDREGKLSLESYASLLKGGQKGAVINPANGNLSRLILVLTGKAEPKMPPEGEESPKPEEIALLKAWIDAGAKGPEGKGPDLTLLVTPQIPLTAPPKLAVHAIAIAPQGSVVAIARHDEVELQSHPDRKLLLKLSGYRGSVNAVAFSDDGQFLVAAAGEPGLFGEARLWKVADGSLVKVFQGHKDSLYAVRLSPDGTLLATGSYDSSIKLWNVADASVAKSLEGHNGAVFELAFRKDGKVLASASGDRTVKLWDVASGQRLDTLKESQKELYTLAFSPDGTRLAAAGVDNRIRLWQISHSAKEGTNPLLLSKFAHETPVLRLAWSADGRTVVSTGEDRLVKIWNADTMTIRTTLEKQPDWASGVAILPDSTGIVVGRIDGSVASYVLAAGGQSEKPLVPLPEVPPEVDYGPQPPLDQLPLVVENEPNDEPPQAGAIAAPGRASGVIRVAQPNQPYDEDLFRFEAKTGEQWIVETNAARSGSPLDSKIEVLDAAGNPVPRLLLRAVRDTVIEFRGMNSDQRGVRLANWEEMLLNEYVYLSGEVIKHYQQRRGPDADSNFYPENGARWAYFDTTPKAHALGEPGYVVVPYAVGTELPNNGLPIFTVYFENDDDSQRRLGKDSRLTFVAPRDGTYFVRVSDVRGFSGEGFKYELILRRPQPNFKVTVNVKDPTENAASGKQFTVKAERIDNFNGPIRVDITGLPPGFQATTPLVIQEGLTEAHGVINALPDAPPTTAENMAATRLTAAATIAGKEVTHDVGSFGTIKLGDKPKVIVHLELVDRPVAVGSVQTGFPQPPELSITPGGTVTCKLRVERHGFDDRIQFDVPNLPHGVIVDDIGLNGILIPEGKTERTMFLRAEPWVPEQSRTFFAVAQVEGNQVSCPMVLHVRRQRE
jgi:WD40 repeat protein